MGNSRMCEVGPLNSLCRCHHHMDSLNLKGTCDYTLPVIHCRPGAGPAPILLVGTLHLLYVLSALCLVSQRLIQ